MLIGTLLYFAIVICGLERLECAAMRSEELCTSNAPGSYANKGMINLEDISKQNRFHGAHVDSRNTWKPCLEHCGTRLGALFFEGDLSIRYFCSPY
jgi:hypothetical protein